MKTIEDLVDKLNATFDYADFYIEKDDELETYTINMRVPDRTYSLIEITYGKRWIGQPDFGLASIDVQKVIMDFIYTTDKEHWFDKQEKQYNIIIGEDVGMIEQSAYRKCWFGARVINDVDEDDLASDEFMFTESEIEELKSKVSEQSAKIIDIAKVEVKDN